MFKHVFLNGIARTLGVAKDSVYRGIVRVTGPFTVEAGENRQIAVKVIDPRGNELIVVKKLEGKR